jgi:RIO kinase 1
MPSKSAEMAELESFFEEGWINEVLYRVKSGKEATVYCCSAEPSISGAELVAAKVYRSQQHRGFKDDAVYREGKEILDKRLKRAFDKKTRKGREVQYQTWIGYEYETLTMLHEAGAAVPRPITQGSSAILIEYKGDQTMAAPVLNNVELEPEEVQPIFDLLMQNIELWLANNRVHADLSPYNILYWEGNVTIIDFPQAIDPRFNHSAYDLLERDIENVCHYMERYDFTQDASELTAKLWWKFQNSQL